MLLRVEAALPPTTGLIDGNPPQGCAPYPRAHVALPGSSIFHSPLSRAVSP